MQWFSYLDKREVILPSPHFRWVVKHCALLENAKQIKANYHILSVSYL